MNTILIASFALCVPALAGDLDPPPGLVTETMKTLDEVEPRTAINAENTPFVGSYQFQIREPGSYYLASDVTTEPGAGGIEVLAPDVTIDLNGFTIRYSGGASATGHGIIANNSGNVVIRNGALDGFPLDGVLAGDNAVIESLRVVNCGADGIDVGQNSRVTACSAIGNGATGIRTSSESLIERSSASRNGDRGILTGEHGTVTDCRAIQNASEGILLDGGNSVTRACVASSNGAQGFLIQRGVVAECVSSLNVEAGFASIGSSVFENCLARNNGAFGFQLNNMSEATDCVSRSNASVGFMLSNDCLLTSCVSSNNGGDGVMAPLGCSIVECSVNNNDGNGIVVTSKSRIVGNQCAGNGVDGGDGAGIRVIGTDCRIESNNVTDNNLGIKIVGINGNIVVKNSASGNTTNYDIPPNNDVGTIQTTPVGAGPWDNFDY